MKLFCNLFSSACESAADSCQDGLFILPPASTGDPGGGGPIHGGLVFEDTGLNIVTEDTGKPIITEN